LIIALLIECRLIESNRSPEAASHIQELTTMWEAASGGRLFEMRPIASTRREDRLRQRQRQR